jgi:hypothetical protein
MRYFLSTFSHNLSGIPDEIISAPCLWSNEPPVKEWPRIHYPSILLPILAILANLSNPGMHPHSPHPQIPRERRSTGKGRDPRFYGVFSYKNDA